MPTLADWLTAGGDARILLDAEGRNRYGCAPTPDPSLIALGSATASVIAPAGYAAAARLQQAVFADGELSGAGYAQAMEGVRRELFALCGVGHLPGLAAVFAASGTDLHLIAAQLAAAVAAPAPLSVVIAGAQESGKGVPAALTGCHFSTRGAQGAAVTPGAALTDAYHPRLRDIALRDAAGALREAEVQDADFIVAVTAAVDAGQPVLAVLADVSKTGCLAPHPASLLDLQTAHPGALTVLVDACQFRLAPATLCAYLEHGSMVALTGSKFLAGPAFSGVLLIPQRVAAAARVRPLPKALNAYCVAGDWPADWPGAAHLPPHANPGLLLRWEAALDCLRAFRALPAGSITEFVARFAHKVSTRLARDPCWVPLPTPGLDRRPLAARDWDAQPTVFPFLLRDATGRWLSREAVERLWRELAAPGAQPRVQLGQPVACGVRDGVPVSALRVCLSARLIVDALASPLAAAQVLGQVDVALDALRARL